MIRRQFFAMFALAAPVFLSACMSPPTGLDLSQKRQTTHNRYIVEVQSLATPVLVNRMHTWQATVKLPSGEPVSGARIMVDGGMPQHGHGYPTQPRVTKELAEGRYLIEGMKFSMTGWWELKLTIESAAGADDVTFNTIIAGQ